MKQKLIFRAFAGILVLLLASAAAHAGPIRIAFRDTTVVGGTQFDYPVYIDSSLTGSGVSAYQIEFTFNSSVFTFINARSESTMTSAWGAPEYNFLSAGKIRIAGAGADTLSGTGKLVILRFAAGIFTYGTGGYFSFQSTLLNQGTPETAKRDGYVSVNPPLSISVSPDTWLMTKGETKQFSVSGGKAPYTWTTTNPLVASIGSTGMLTSLSAGITKVVCVDSAGIVDTSGTIEVRALALSLHDTARYQGQWLDLPVYITNVSGLGITSGQFSITYNENLWKPDSFVTTGTLLSGWVMAPMSVGPNKINVSFASSSSLSGSGILLYIRMKAATTTYGSAVFNFTNQFFNESILANISGGYITVTQLVPITVTPGGTQTIVAGDSIQFSASAGTPPYAWSVSDTSRASISSLGWLKAKKSGSVVATAQDFIGATGNSGTINIFDFRLSVPDTSLIPAATADIPLFVSSNMIGFSSVQMKVTYTTGSYVKLIDVISAGTLTEGWSVDKTFSPGSITLAGAGATSRTSGGTLLKLRFAVPDSTPRPSTIYITLSNVVFNQDIPLPLIDNGYFTVANSAIFKITPASGVIQTDAINKKDSTTFTVRNTGTATLTSSISISGSGEFTLSTYNISVPPSDSVKIKAYYLPVNAGNDTATINFSTNDPFHPNVAVGIIGAILQFPVLSISADSIHFGGIKVGMFKDTTVTLTNNGTDTLKIFSLAASIGVFTAQTTSVNIPPGASFADTLRFTPAAVTTYSGRFIITSNASSSPDTIKVTGIGLTSLGIGQNGIQPMTFRLNQNFPNPFNPVTTISYELPAGGFISLKVYDLLGKEAATLVNGMQDAGSYSVPFDASNLTTGMYIYRLTAGDFVAVKKLLLMK